MAANGNQKLRLLIRFTTVVIMVNLITKKAGESC